jgi:hypothetical protein
MNFGDWVYIIELVLLILAKEDATQIAICLQGSF